jgi:hypothetical protein
MKTINQEILLMTATTFSQKEWCEKDGQGKKTSNTDKLEEACWNGLLNEILPGIIEKSSTGKNLLLWQIIQYRSFLEIDLCESRLYRDRVRSISPYLFLPLMFCN